MSKTKTHDEERIIAEAQRIFDGTPPFFHCNGEKVRIKFKHWTKASKDYFYEVAAIRLKA